MLLKWIIFPLILLLLCICLAIVLVIESKPIVVEHSTLSFDDVSRIKQLIKTNNPKQLRNGEVRDVSLNQRDLNLLLLHALKRYNQMQLHATLEPSQANIKASLAMPVGGYINIRATLSQKSDQLNLTNVHLGSVRVPQFLVKLVVNKTHRYALHNVDAYTSVINAIDDFAIKEEKVYVRYRWHGDILKNIRQQSSRLLFSQDDQERLAIYHQHLAQMSQQAGGKWASLNQFLAPMFALAAKRSADGEDAVAENRALIYALASYVVGANIKQFLPEESHRQQPPKRIRLLLHRRQDLMQHFVLSAAVTVSGGSSLADTVGVFKEIDDSQGGSGFSFADLLADRAGIRFAELATSNKRNAKKLQQLMSKSDLETDYMPRIDQLPEGIMELEFKARYEDLDSKSYQLVEDEIQRRISASNLYKQFG